MTRPSRALAVALAGAILSAACGGAAAPAAPAATTAAATTPPATAAAATSAPASPSASAAPAYAGVGAAVTKLSEVKTTVAAAPVHMGFIGDQASLAPGTYTETLSLVTLQPGGRTISHKHGGLEVVIVLEGSVDINMGNAGRAALSAGQTAKVPAGTALQASNAGSGVARFLAFFMTPEGAAFQTNLTTVP